MLGANFALIFGGAAQDGIMSQECFILNTLTFEWKKVEITNSESASTIQSSNTIPSARAAPNLVRYNETCAILYGGAKASSTQGLQALSDVWAINVNRFNGTGQWHRLSNYTLKDGTSTVLSDTDGKLEIVSPPPRNAATLNTIGDEIDKKSREYLLFGGWKPFQVTWGDSFMLRVRQR